MISTEDSSITNYGREQWDLSWHKVPLSTEHRPGFRARTVAQETGVRRGR